MKTIHRSLGAAAVLGITALLSTPAGAQTVTQTTTTAEPVTSIGTISNFGPDVIAIQSDSMSTPTTYRYSKSTTYVDETGAPVSMETVRSGLPVTVYYSGTGPDAVASKVVVRKTTTTTTE